MSGAYDGSVCNDGGCGDRATAALIKEQFNKGDNGELLTRNDMSNTSRASRVKPSAMPSTAGNPLAGGPGVRSFPRPLD